MKRFFDLLSSLILIFCLAPLFLVVALVIFCASPGGVIYAQPRLGKNGRPFSCYKFRTIYLDADEKLELLLATNVHLRNEWRLNQKLKFDPRIFPMGGFLRKFSLDELPQLFNVFKGDLSLVGPRPYMLNQEPQLGSYRDKILSVKPGITGLWQTSGRSHTTFQRRVELDAAYVEQCSLFFDLKLICKTLPAVLFNDDAC